MSRHSLVGRGMRSIAVLAVVTTLATGMYGTSALAEPAQPPVSSASAQATQQSTTDQKAAAARVLNVQLTPAMAGMSDLNFVIELWKLARQGSHVKTGAEQAFGSSDAEACYRFITEGIFAAHERDVRELAEKAERDRQRIKAATVVGWSNVPQAHLDSTLADFVFRLWERAENGSEVKAKAAAVLTETSTDAQRQQYVTTDIFTADEADKMRRREQAEREERERQEKLANIKAREDAWRVAAQAPLTENLKLITDSEFVYEVFRRSAGAKVKAAAQAALDTRDPALIKAFIFTGVHTAHQADLAERDERDAAETLRRLNEIIDKAKRDGFQPNLVEAAEMAKAGTLAQRNAFLNGGDKEAAKKDLIKPADRLVVELQGIGSARCVQVVGLDGDANAESQRTELWDCVRGPKMVWELHDLGNDEYLVKNLNSKKCMDAAGDDVVQYTCDDRKSWQRWKFIEIEPGRHQLQNIGTGRFATVRDSATGNGSAIGQHSNTKNVDQLWRLIDPSHRAGIATIEPKSLSLKGVQSGRCVQTAGLWDRPDEGALANLAQMELWDCVGGKKMDWEVVDLGRKKYALKNKLSGKCLDVMYGDHANDTSLVQYDCHLGGGQQFVFTGGADGKYGLQSVLTGKFADAIGQTVHNGARVATWEHNGLANQLWTVIATDAVAGG